MNMYMAKVGTLYLKEATDTATTNTFVGTSTAQLGKIFYTEAEAIKAVKPFSGTVIRFVEQTPALLKEQAEQAQALETALESVASLTAENETLKARIAELESELNA